jgi:hypothetical protein
MKRVRSSTVASWIAAVSLGSALAAAYAGGFVDRVGADWRLSLFFGVQAGLLSGLVVRNLPTLACQIRRLRRVQRGG